MAGVANWQRIVPDAHHDWLDHRDPTYQEFMPLAIKSQKFQTDVSAAFSLLSLGIATNRDSWVYSFDRKQLNRRLKTMTAFYEQRRQAVMDGEMTAKQACVNDAPTQIKWTRGLRYRLQRQEPLTLKHSSFRWSMYRPFCKQHVYFDAQYIEVVYRIPVMFPTPDAPNQVIGVTGRGASKQFSVLITDVIPDIQVIFNGQWFSRWRYEAHDSNSPDAWAQTEDAGLGTVPGYRRIDNNTDWCRQQFRTQYPALQITKDDIWSYLYGLLHAPDYRERYRADLSKDLPRIPFAANFGAFRDAGAELAHLHLGYETCPEYELQVDVNGVGDSVYRLSNKTMKWGGTQKEPDRSVLHVTPAVTLRGIPEAAYNYVVNGRTPLEWAVDRLHIRHDKENGIINDPNAWFADHPAGLVSHLRRLVQVSMETTRIVAGLPPALED